MRPDALRRFSTGRRPPDIAGLPVWKFDTLIVDATGNPVLKTCYAAWADRSLAFQNLFARCPGAKVYGTGLPLTLDEALIETGRPLSSGELHFTD